MSWEANYNPSDPAVPNVVTAWNEVDAPTGNPNTINNPDISLVGLDYSSIHPVGNCKISGNQVIPFTLQDATRWDLFQGPAKQSAPLAIKNFIFHDFVGKIPKTILTGIKKGAAIRFFCEGIYRDSQVSFSTLEISVQISNSNLIVVSKDGQAHEIYLDIIYS